MENKPLGFLLGAGVFGRPIPIGNSSITTLGRDESNTIPLDDLNASRKHAYVEGREGLLYITDLDSSNGTFVDDERIQPRERVQLACGQEIRIGGRVFYVVSAQSPLETQKVAVTRAGAFSKKPTLGAGFSLKATQEEIQKAKKQKMPPRAPAASAPPTPVVPAAPTATAAQAPASVAVQKTLKFSGSETRAVKPEPVAKAPSPPPPSNMHEYTLSGAVNAGSLPQIIQMISSKRFSGSMKVKSNAATATILFVNGELYAAFSPGENGAAVIYRCALEKNAYFTFEKLENSAVEISPRNIKIDTMQILMECCCKIHEARQGL